MAFEVNYRNWAIGASVGLALAAGPSLHAQSTIEVSPAVARSIDHGSVNPLAESNVTVHLKLHNEAAYTKAVDELYKPGSPTYHQWFTKADFAKYAPTTTEVEAVKRELQSHGLTITSVDQNNYSIRARGTSVNLERAFQTQIHQVEYKGQKFSANIAPARLTGAAGDLVDTVAGLSNPRLKNYFARPTNLVNSKPLPSIPVAKAKQVGIYGLFTNDCFAAPITEYLTTAGSALPAGVFTGNNYQPGLQICGWTPEQVATYYSLTAAYKAGTTGAGQTIVIVDGPTNSDYVADLKDFSSFFGLPAITSSNFKVIYPDGPPTPFQLQYFDSTGETQLDIEWAHAIAPKANIVLLIVPTFDDTELQYAVQYAITHKLGNVISNSYGGTEVLEGPATVRAWDNVLKAGAAAGVAVNFSSGDSGDSGFGVPNAGGNSYPANSVYATSIGGTSIGLPSSRGLTEVGWGTNITILSFYQDELEDPPFLLGSYFGAGGGQSQIIPKPAWQHKLLGSFRQQPDISAFADPYTGAIVVVGGEVGTIGGTSLSSPVFSGIWALADQKAGKSLGQVAPQLTSLLGSIKDIVPYGNPNNVSGAIIDSSGTTAYTAESLLQPLYSAKYFYSALWDGSGDGSGEWIDLSFGTDSSLQTQRGWDNVTGYGVPIGSAFINAAAALK